jgi:hypothetical protein
MFTGLCTCTTEFFYGEKPQLDPFDEQMKGHSESKISLLISSHYLYNYQL